VWREGDLPEAREGVLLALEDDVSGVFQNGHVVFGEVGFKVAVAELTDGDECTVVQ
jgi:hypothetical protein